MILSLFVASFLLLLQGIGKGMKLHLLPRLSPNGTGRYPAKECVLGTHRWADAQKANKVTRFVLRFLFGFGFGLVWFGLGAAESSII